jgi:hypothetical protein
MALEVVLIVIMSICGLLLICRYYYPPTCLGDKRKNYQIVPDG